MLANGLEFITMAKQKKTPVVETVSIESHQAQSAQEEGLSIECERLRKELEDAKNALRACANETMTMPHQAALRRARTVALQGLGDTKANFENCVQRRVP